jgi:hypothetical protein
MSSPSADIIDRLLDPVGLCLTPEVAQALVKLRADPIAQARVDELADKCNEGQMTAAERSEYETYVWASRIIAVLQAKSRALLSRSSG